MNIEKADKVFSEYIRRRDADGNGFVKCCTCDHIAHWKEMHCGHFVSRNNLSVRWNDLNAHAQCPVCNTTRGGACVEYEAFMVEKYDEQVPEYLRRRGHQAEKFMQHQIDYITNFYTEQLKLL